MKQTLTEYAKERGFTIEISEYQGSHTLVINNTLDRPCISIRGLDTHDAHEVFRAFIELQSKKALSQSMEILKNVPIPHILDYLKANDMYTISAENSVEINRLLTDSRDILAFAVNTKHAPAKVYKQSRVLISNIDAYLASE